MSTVIELKKVNAGYGPIQVLWDVNLEVHKGEIVAILGPNGAGKTTTLRTIMGLTDLYSGSINYYGKDISKLSPHERVKLGIALVPEGRQLFPHMSVYENLILGAYSIRDERMIRDRLEFIYNLFPFIKTRSWQKAGSLSGGEQQMVAIARALMTYPKLLMLDEPSQGLAPKIVQDVFSTLIKLRDEEDITILIVEQYVKDALEVSDRVYVIRGGKIVYEARAKDIKDKSEFIKLYLS
jgi:branched-chain amino acid transport system ATP-binding protein